MDTGTCINMTSGSKSDMVVYVKLTLSSNKHNSWKREIWPTDKLVFGIFFGGENRHEIIHKLVKNTATTKMLLCKNIVRTQHKPEQKMSHSWVRVSLPRLPVHTCNENWQQHVSSFFKASLAVWERREKTRLVTTSPLNHEFVNVNAVYDCVDSAINQKEARNVLLRRFGLAYKSCLYTLIRVMYKYCVWRWHLEWHTFIFPYHCTHLSILLETIIYECLHQVNVKHKVLRTRPVSAVNERTPSGPLPTWDCHWSTAFTHEIMWERCSNYLQWRSFLLISVSVIFLFVSHYL